MSPPLAVFLLLQSRSSRSSALGIFVPPATHLPSLKTEALFSLPFLRHVIRNLRVLALDAQLICDLSGEPSGQDVPRALTPSSP